MLRRMSGSIVLALMVLTWMPAFAQDQQPSLGDVARQLRKDKEKNATAPKKVITEDSLPSGKALSGFNDLGSSQNPNDAMARGLAGLDHAEELLNKLAPLDRATLAKAALLDNDVDFPGRRAWEDKLYAAKEQYVSHGRELFKEMRQLLAEVQSLRSSQPGDAKLSSSDPRTQEIIRRMQDMVQDAVRTDSAYQSVVMEGWDRAKQAKH